MTSKHLLASPNIPINELIMHFPRKKTAAASKNARRLFFSQQQLFLISSSPNRLRRTLNHQYNMHGRVSDRASSQLHRKASRRFSKISVDAFWLLVKCGACRCSWTGFGDVDRGHGTVDGGGRYVPTYYIHMVDVCAVLPHVVLKGN